MKNSKIRTIHDIQNRNYSDENNEIYSVNYGNDMGVGLNKQDQQEYSSQSSKPRANEVNAGGYERRNTDWKPPECYHIPSLPLADTSAKAMLKRVVQEFEPIMKRRLYDVVSVSEMCCCNDGLDFAPTKNGKKRRKIRKTSNNLWGYNSFQIVGKTRFHSEIHLRLRGFHNHNVMLSYEDVAGTMAHELAHCEVSEHNAQFYKVMNSILDEHAALMSSGITRSYNAADGARTMRESIPAFSGTGYTLNHDSTAINSSSRNYSDKSLALDAALKRQRNNGLGFGSNRLGGDTTFSQWMTPTEAAVAAAEARRIQQQLHSRGDYYQDDSKKSSTELQDMDCFICQPCDESERADDSILEEEPTPTNCQTLQQNQDSKEYDLIREHKKPLNSKNTVMKERKRPAAATSCQEPNRHEFDELQIIPVLPPKQSFQSKVIKMDQTSKTASPYSSGDLTALSTSASGAASDITYKNSVNQLSRFSTDNIVDLTTDDDNDNHDNDGNTINTYGGDDSYAVQCAILQSSVSVASTSVQGDVIVVAENEGWSCSRCTYFNRSSKMKKYDVDRRVLVCNICLSEQ